MVDDGCGNTLDCGTCSGNEVCGAGGTPGQCSSCASGPCVPFTCADIGLQEGAASDGCSGAIACGTGGCGPMVIPGCCGVVTNPPGANYVWNCPEPCMPKSCTEQGCCGLTTDFCGNPLDCGPCGADAGPPCSACVPKTCAELGFNCGLQGDGCGNQIDCGTCDPCVACNNGVCAGKFVSACVPNTCADQGIECGFAVDGCCNGLSCGTCPSGLACWRGKCLGMCM